MKNLKSIAVAGMIGFGSLFGFNGFGQDVLEEIPELNVIAQYTNHQEFQIETWREFGDGSIVLNKYFDTNRDGKFDSFDSTYIFDYSPEHNKVSKVITEDIPSHIEALYPNWVKKNLPLGETFTNCEKGYFKENIHDYINSSSEYKEIDRRMQELYKKDSVEFKEKCYDFLNKKIDETLGEILYYKSIEKPDLAEVEHLKDNEKLLISLKGYSCELFKIEKNLDKK